MTWKANSLIGKYTIEYNEEFTRTAGFDTVSSGAAVGLQEFVNGLNLT